MSMLSRLLQWQRVGGFISTDRNLPLRNEPVALHKVRGTGLPLFRKSKTDRVPRGALSWDAWMGCQDMPCQAWHLKYRFLLHPSPG